MVGDPADHGRNQTEMMNFERMTKAELIRRITALEKIAPVASVAFERERLLHELQVRQMELETQNHELREAQAILEEMRARYADLYDFAPVGYATLDSAGVIREINLIGAEMLGEDRSRLIGVSFHLHVARENLAEFRKHLGREATPDERVTTELRLLRKGREPLPVVMQSQGVFHEEEAGLQWLAAFTDLSMQKQAEQAAQEGAELNRGILGSITAHIAVIDREGRIIAVNEAWNRFAQENGGASLPRHGVGSDYVAVCQKATDGLDAIAKEALEGIQAVLERRLPSFRMEYPCHSPHQRRWYLLSVTPLATERGGAVLSHADITQRYLVEEAISEKEARLRAVLDTANDGILTIDERGVIKSFNQASEKLFGYAALEAIGQNVKTLMPSPYRERHDHYLANYRATGAGKIIGIGREVEGQRKDGSIFPMDLSISEVRLGDRRIFTGIVRDITERRRDEQRWQLQYDMARVLAAAGSLTETVPELLRVVAETFQWDVGEFWEVEDESATLRPVHVWHGPGKKLAAFVRHSSTLAFPMFDGLPGRVIASGAPAWVSPITECPEFLRQKAAVRAGLRSALAFPIMLNDRTLGVAAFLTDRVAQPDPDLLNLLGTLGSQIGQFMERKKAEETLREERDFSAAVLDTTGALVIVLDESGQIVRFNRACEQLTGRTEAEVSANDLWKLLLVPSEMDSVRAVFEDLRTTKVPNRHENHWVTKTGERRLIAWSNTVLTNEQGTVKFIIGTGLDITQRVRAETALQRRTQQLQAIAELSHHALEGVDFDRLLRDTAELVAHVLGVECCGVFEFRPAAGDLLLRAGAGWQEGCVGCATMSGDPAFQGGFTLHSSAPVVVGESADATRFRADEFLLRHGVVSGITAVIRDKLNPYGVLAACATERRGFSDDEVFFVQSVVEVLATLVERRQLEEELLAISGRELRRIGQDLHDGLCQHLAGIEFRTEALARDLEGHPTARAEAERICAFVREGTAQARMIARGLHPVELEQNGLISALSELTADSAQLYRIECRFDAGESVPVTDHATATQLYRIAQETISNAVRHGRARAIEVALRAAGEDAAVLTITNDGAPLPTDPGRSGGMGLRIMHYRAELIGATLRLGSTAEGKTELSCTFQPQR